jgi:hypothetical protein
MKIKYTTTTIPALEKEIKESLQKEINQLIFQK